jgi:sulfur relay protein TusC/DsrF
LDIAFAAAVFDRQVRYLFIGDGVWQLKKYSDSSSALEALGKKPMGSALETLELYVIDRVYALRTSIDERGLSPAELIDCVEIIDEPAVRELLAGPGPIVNL